jgi:hypothetical protein
MHRSRWAACACAIAWTVIPMGADAAGVYENAGTESALLVSPQRITVRGTVEIGSSPPLDAVLYRAIGTFPARSWFLVWVEMPFVAVSGPDGVESGPGDFILRAKARLWGGDGRALALLSTMGTGTGDRRFFPYSAQTFDICTSVGYVDSIGALQPFAIVGYQFVNRVVDSLYTDDTAPANHSRVTAGANLDLGDRGHVGGGVMYHWYSTGAERSIVFAGAAFDWTPMFRIGVEGQLEVGEKAQRVGDWSLTAGLQVFFGAASSPRSVPPGARDRPLVQSHR